MFGRLSGEKAALMLFGCGTFEKLDALLLLEMPLDAWATVCCINLFSTLPEPNLLFIGEVIWGLYCPTFVLDITDFPIFGEMNFWES